MSLVLGGQKFLGSLVGWDSVKGGENEDEDEAKSEDRIDKNWSKQSNWILLGFSSVLLSNQLVPIIVSV